eukprot:1190270-Prorocentrum_minimum.AAC.1
MWSFIYLAHITPALAHRLATRPPSRPRHTTHSGSLRIPPMSKSSNSLNWMMLSIISTSIALYSRASLCCCTSEQTTGHTAQAAVTNTPPYRHTPVRVTPDTRTLVGDPATGSYMSSRALIARDGHCAQGPAIIVGCTSRPGLPSDANNPRGYERTASLYNNRITLYLPLRSRRFSFFNLRGSVSRSQKTNLC